MNYFLRFFFSFSLLSLLTIGFSIQAQYSTSYRLNEEDVKTRVDSVLRLMTLEEKIGQMRTLTVNPANEDIDGDDLSLLPIREGKIGSLLNVPSPQMVYELQRIAVEESRLGIPLLFGVEEGRFSTVSFPTNLAKSCSWDVEAINKVGQVKAQEAARGGYHYFFVPMASNDRQFSDGYISESYGQAPFLAKYIAKNKVSTIQDNAGQDAYPLAVYLKYIDDLKSDPANQRDSKVTLSSGKYLDDYFAPLKGAVEAGTIGVMPVFPAESQMTEEEINHIYRTLLRDNWGYRGTLMTDYSMVDKFVPKGVTDRKEAALHSFLAEVEMDKEGMAFADQLKELVEEGEIEEKQVDEAVRRILITKFLLGLFDDPYRLSVSKRQAMYAHNLNANEVCRDIARKSLVLLKNENQLLPLKKNKQILVLGPLAGTTPVSQEITSSAALSFVEAIRKQAGKNATVTYVDAVNGAECKELPAVISLANKADVVIYVMGANQQTRFASSSDSKTNEKERALLRKLRESGVSVVTLLINERPLLLEEEYQLSNALIECWMPSTESGNAIADVIFGNYNPSGKLTVNIPKGRNEATREINSSLVNSKDSYLPENSYLFPLGYGLSYTSFEYSTPTVNSQVVSSQKPLEITISVKNAGKYDGEEVVQLYVTDLEHPNHFTKDLKGFQKVALKKGEAENVSFVITPDDLAYTHENGEFTYSPGRYKAYVGTNSRDVREVEFELLK